MSDSSPFLTFQQKAKIGIIGILLTLLLLGAFIAIVCAPASAIEINPSVETMPWACQYEITKFLCDMDKPGAPGQAGANGINGINGTNNFSAMYWNSSNFTSYQNLSTFINSSYFNVTSNYTIFEGATVNLYNSSVNESYAYLPGREGGQTLNGGTTSGNLVLNGSTNNGNVIILPVLGLSGNVGIGVSNPIAKLQISPVSGYTSFGMDAPPNENDMYFYNREWGFGYNRSENSGGSINLRGYRLGSTQFRDLGIYNGKGVSGLIAYFDGSASALGIGTTTPTSQLHTTGTVRFANYGAGTATFDAGGNITSVSDSKYKTAVKPYVSSLSQVNSVTPKQWKYSASSGLDTQNYYSGFIAQEVEAAGIPAVFTKEDVKYVQEVTKANGEDVATTKEVKTGTTTKSIDDRALIATLWNALKEEDAKVRAQQAEIDELKARLDKAKL